MPKRFKVRRRKRPEIRRAPFIMPIGDGSGYILLVHGMTPRQFDSLAEAIAARDAGCDVVTC